MLKNQIYIGNYSEDENPNESPGGPCHHVGVGPPLQQINTRARVLSGRSEKTRERKLKKEKTICLTSYAAWWYRMEKDERKFFRDVDKTEQATRRR